MKKCKQAHRFSQRSGLMGFECIHLKSLAYCPRSSDPDVSLSELVLTDMVSRKWISNTEGKMCLERKKMSDYENSPLSKEVKLGGGASQIHISVLEPRVSYYSRLGRVMVCYNKNKDTWHCPCPKPGASCPHKSIAKWHLNQTQPEVFRSAGSSDGDVVNICADVGPDAELSTDGIQLYPPKGTALAALVLYLLSNKKIPVVLPKDASTPRSPESLPKHLIPLEMFCANCPETVPLSEPVIITERAKIVTFTGTTEGRSHA